MTLLRFGFLMTVNAFALGITLPIMNVVLLERGLTLSTLALFMAVYSAIIVVTEIPSGYLSDRFGRIPVFVLAKGCSAVGMALIVFTSSTGYLFLAAVLLSLARSFSSGSLEAVVVDWFKDREGEEKFHVITTHMSIWETLGLSAGALSSGFAVILFEHRGLFADGNLSVFLISALLQVLIIVCIVCWMRDFSLELPQEQHPSATTFTSALQNRKFLSILILTFALGFVLSSLEKYWQVRLIAITVADDLATILLGVVSFLGFMTALIGSVFSGSLINRSRSSVSRYLLVFHILLAASLVLLAYAHSHISFLILYACVYLFVSMSSVASGTIINTEIPSSLRALLLSTVSFALQIGGLVSSLFASLYLAKERVTISSVWIIAAGVLLISLIPLGVQESKRAMLTK